MFIQLEKASGRSKCRHQLCKAKPEFIKNDRIIKGTTCAAISSYDASGGHTSYYCRDCIDIIYEDIRKILNPKLWIFH